MQHGSLVGKVSMFTRAQGTAAQNFCGSLFAMLKHAHLEVAYHCWQVIVSLPRTATCHGRSIQPRGHQLRPCECTGHCFLSVVDYVASCTASLSQGLMPSLAFVRIARVTFPNAAFLVDNVTPFFTRGAPQKGT